MTKKEPKKYVVKSQGLPDRILSVEPGLGDQYIVCYRNDKTGGRHRFKSKELPPVKTRPLCQMNLDAYAKKHGLKEATE